MKSSANLTLIRRCTEDVYIYQANPGDNDNCNTGWTDKCFLDPWIIPSMGHQLLKYKENNQGTSVKISKGSDFSKGIFQFEYTYAPDGIYWDISDLDGRGPGLVGTPFFDHNVKISPTGPGVGQGTCVSVRCPANTICLDSYQAPDEQKTRVSLPCLRK